MGKRFKYLRSVKKDYAMQGYIFFCCRNYRRLPPHIQGKIDSLCEAAGGEHAAALKAQLCTDMPWQTVCVDYALDEKTLRRVRKRFYDMW